MKRFSTKDIWVLIIRILVFEVIFGVGITTLNLVLDLENIYKSLSIVGFLSFEIFSLAIIVISETIGIIEIYTIWYRKYGKGKVKGKDKIISLVRRGEGRKIEFKKSLRWDYQENKINKELEKSVIKTIAGFLNSEGGTLLIGIADNKMVNGLSEDYQTLPRKDKDGFENYMVQLIRVNTGPASLRLINISFYNFDGRDVCKTVVGRSSEPVFLKFNGIEEFYVRSGNSTTSLTISESLHYIKNHWKVVVEKNN